MDYDIKSIRKSLDHTHLYIKRMMDTHEFSQPQHAFVVLKAVLRALRDRLEPGEMFHLGGQLPALLRGYYYEGLDYGSLINNRIKVKGINEFYGVIRDYLKAYDFLNMEKVVLLTMNVILNSIDEGEARQVINQLPKEVKKTFLEHHVRESL